ncbi:unnamed protein product [Symbiodinium natans]|uniref:Uncharacterized protein n=1 Tax=Symbiodinium natans TaxID=878477 RepID=A0A812GI13_9DINO|nr:unnamed protein product [Symbiodinium natans]
MAPPLPAAEQYSVFLDQADAVALSLETNAAAFSKALQNTRRRELAAARAESHRCLGDWSAQAATQAQSCSELETAAVQARKAAFRWDQRFNPLSSVKGEAQGAKDMEELLKQRGLQLQIRLHGLQQSLAGLKQSLVSLDLPPLLMRTGEPELLNGEVLGCVTAAVGQWGGISFSMSGMMEGRCQEERASFAQAGRLLQQRAQQLGADAVVGVRWLQCDCFQVKEEKSENGPTTFRRVQRHKTYEAMLCGTAVRIPEKVSEVSEVSESALPYTGPVFASTVREPPHGTRVDETLGIVQGVGANANWSLTLNPTAACKQMADREAAALHQARQQLLQAAAALGANAVLGVKPEEPMESMCVLRGTAVRLATEAGSNLQVVPGCFPPSTLQTPPANLHVAEVKGLVACVAGRPPQWFTWEDPSDTDAQAFGEAVRGLAQQAQAMGANAVLGVKWMHDNNRFVSQAVGTAVVLGQEPQSRIFAELPPPRAAVCSTLRNPPEGFAVSSVLGIVAAAALSPFRDYSRGGYSWNSQRTAMGELAALERATAKLQAAATSLGADAVLGLKIEALSVWNCSRFMCVLKGTAVRLSQFQEEVHPIPFNHSRVEVSAMQTPAKHLCVSSVLGLVCSVGYRQWRFGGFGVLANRRRDAESEQETFSAAVNSLIVQAQQMGANGVMGIKWTHDDDHRSSCLVGTAVVLSQKPGVPPPSNLGSGRPPFLSNSRAPPKGLEVAHTIGVFSGAGISSRLGAFSTQAVASIDEEALQAARACLEAQAVHAGCDAVLGVKLESPETGLVLLRGTGVQLTKTMP